MLRTSGLSTTKGVGNADLYSDPDFTIAGSIGREAPRRPTMGRLDGSLDRLLTDLAERLAASRHDRISVQPDDLVPVGPECADVLCGQGLLVPDEPARIVICDGCDRGCAMEVVLSTGPDRAMTQAFIVCDQRDDIGRVPVDRERLRRWQFTLEGIAGQKEDRGQS